MEKILIQKTGTVTYQIEFDFTSDEQREILQYLQVNNYRLLGYKGAVGINQVFSGVPVWFSIPYDNIFGLLEIDCEPRYKVYVFNKADISVNTTIMMQALSDEIPLGARVEFNSDGSFRTVAGGTEGEITVQNNRPPGTPPVTIGLAAKVNGQYQPFCAFICNSQGNVSMRPNERIILFASQTNMTSGSITGHTTNSGCSFMFSTQNINYNLRMLPTTHGITHVPGAAPVMPVSSGTSLVPILNNF